MPDFNGRPVKVIIFGQLLILFAVITNQVPVAIAGLSLVVQGCAAGLGNLVERHGKVQ